PTFAHHRRQIHIERQQVLRRPDPDGVSTDGFDVIGGKLRCRATALDAPATASGLTRPPILPFPCRLYVTVPRPMIRRKTGPSLMLARLSQVCRWRTVWRDR